MHSDREPYLICCWYQPPSLANVETIKSFEAEYLKLRNGAMGFFALGDLNVHSVRWLQHSARESVEGRLLRDISDQLGLRQLVTEPTRGKYLLDLVHSTAWPCASVADYKGVLTQVKFQLLCLLFYKIKSLRPDSYHV